MPELPEVETYRRYLEATALHQRVIDWVVDYDRQLRRPYEEMRRAVVGAAFVRTDRIGKHLFVETDRGDTLVFHFGMTGRLQYFRYAEEAHRHARMQFVFDSGFRLALVDPRLFGRLDLAESVEGYRVSRKISPDALTLSAADLRANLSARRMAIKPALLDQRVAAGIGNWIADEVLFQARVHPEKRVPDLTDADVEALAAALRDVLETAIAHEARYVDFPDRYLIRNRWTKGEDRSALSRERYTCPRCRTPIEQTKVGGRTTFLCPRCQLAPAAGARS